MRITQTRYGKIPNKELIIEKFPNIKGTELMKNINQLYDPFFDKISSPITIKLNNGKLIKLNEKNKNKNNGY